jgi:hypothetical protein
MCLMSKRADGQDVRAAGKVEGRTEGHPRLLSHARVLRGSEVKILALGQSNEIST